MGRGPGSWPGSSRQLPGSGFRGVRRAWRSLRPASCLLRRFPGGVGRIPAAMSVGFIGAGQLACALARGFTAAGGRARAGGPQPGPGTPSAPRARTAERLAGGTRLVEQRGLRAPAGPCCGSDLPSRGERGSRGRGRGARLKSPVFRRHPVGSQDHSQLPGNGPAHGVLAQGRGAQGRGKQGGDPEVSGAVLVAGPRRPPPRSVPAVRANPWALPFHLPLCLCHFPAR